ncbi:MAG: type II toxin-antitoxin system RelE/ParE family toxin [Candidatus Omnitrophota bacterium]
MYKIIYDNRIEKDIRPIPKNLLKVILAKITTLSTNPRPMGAEKLIGISGWRIRAGKYRILYTINDKKKNIAIYRIKHLNLS